MSLVVFILKMDGILPFCVDNRNLTVIKIGDSYSVRRKGACIDLLEKTAIF